jgi:ABC-type spermidine/putrescine transport system permease subunit II
MARPDAMGRLTLYGACVPVLVFLLLPSLVIVPMALTKGQMIQFPPIWISVHSFTDYLGDPQWSHSTVLSLQVAALAVVIGCVSGTASAVALHGARFPGKGLLTGVILAPIIVPVVVFALGGYLVFARLHVLGGWVAIALLHGILVTPYVFISVQTSLVAALNPLLVRSARSLGAGRLSVLRHVVWPAIRPGVLGGGLLGFAISFDEVVVALFLQGPQAVTLPVRMFTEIQFELTPKVAASASLFLALSVVVMLAQGVVMRRRMAA